MRQKDRFILDTKISEKMPDALTRLCNELNNNLLSASIFSTTF
nr:MAG TPA: hypothetical protein [Bacteriophage sp.]